MENKIKLHDKYFKVMIPAAEIDAAVAATAARLNEDYASCERPPIFVCVLSGAFMFLADIVRKVEFNNEVVFVKVSSYSGTQSTGSVKQQLGIEFDIAGRDVIIVEDIVETGHSIDHMVKYLKAKNPRSVEVCSLFYKPEKYLYDMPIKYSALTIGNEFIVGYGLDYDQLGRSLKDVYVVTTDE